MMNENKTIESRIITFLREASGNAVDIFYDVYNEFLKESSAPHALLPIIFEFEGAIGTDDVECTKVLPEIRETVKAQLLEVKDIVKKLAGNNDTPDVFYSKLWNEIFVSSALPHGSEQHAVILKMLNEDIALLPYYQAINLHSMENEEYKKVVDKIRPQILEAIHMLNRNFEQKTERTSQMFRIANTLSQEDAYVYWAAIIDMMEKNGYRVGYSRAVSDIKKRIESEETEE
jgi:hypothetical protein